MAENATPTPSAAAQLIADASRRLADITGLMRSQQETLRSRGISMPPNLMEGLRNLKKRLDSLTRSVNDSQQELGSLRALAETTALINSPQSTDDVLNAVMDTVIKLTGAERGYIVLKNRDNGELEFRVARGMDQSQLDHSSGRIISKSIVNRVADSGEPILTDNATDDPAFKDQASIVGFQLRSILAVPLKVRDEVIGVVYCDNRLAAGLFKQHELEVLKAFANQAAVAIENAMLFDSVRMRLNEITELRDRMENLFASIASGVITVGDDGQILVSNAAAHDIAFTDDLVGHSIFDAFPDIADQFEETLLAVRDTGRQQSMDCDPVIGGRTRHWSVLASLLRAEEGTSGFAVVIDDVTEKKQSESQLVEARRYLPSALAESLGDINLNAITIQEREITALFADVRGFTTFSENLEPEELMTVINKYLSLASDAINLFEGIVDKYMGDAVTGLWNTQLNPQADHPNRAIQAAMQLVLDLHAQHEVLPPNERLFYGIGIHTGAAVLGNVGGAERKEFAALGEATDICKYLQEQAGPGEIIISEQTMQEVEMMWEVEPAEVRRPKSGYEHIRCYRVLKRRKGAASMFVDEELLALLADDDEE
jgi:adenylate cyclase